MCLPVKRLLRASSFGDGSPHFENKPVKAKGHLISGRPGRFVLRPVVTGVAMGLKAKEKSRAILMGNPSRVELELLRTVVTRD